MSGNKRKRGTPATAANYWPGYVDALTNVVLNLLFLIAMFGIALAVMSSSPRHAGPRPTVAGQASGTGSGYEGDGARGDMGSSEAAVLLARAGQSATVPGVPLGPIVAVRTEGMARLAAADVSGGEAGAAPVRAAATGAAGDQRLAMAEAGRRRPDTAGETGGDPAGMPLTQAGGEAATAGSGRAGAGALARTDRGGGSATDPLNFLVADAYRRWSVPGVRVARQADPSGDGILVTVTLAVGTEPVAALQQANFRSSLRVSLAGRALPGDSRLRLWTATRLADPAQRRTAYLALIEARNQLLALGYSPDRIETRLIEGSTTGREGKQFYIHAVPATIN